VKRTGDVYDLPEASFEVMRLAGTADLRFSKQ
jgi:hypothetical protein